MIGQKLGHFYMFLFMRKFLALWFLLVGLPAAFSQEKKTEENEVDEIIDNLLMQNDQDIDALMHALNNFQFLYLSVNYNNDTYFSGRDIGIDQFNIRPQITYMHSKGFFASLSGVYYDGFDPNWDYSSATLGYGTYMDKKKSIRWYSSYSRHFYSDRLDNPFTNDVSMGLGIKNKKRTIGTQLMGTYLFGDENSLQIASRSFVALQLIKTKKVDLKLRPQLSIITGQQTLELAQTSFQNGMLVTNYLENDVFDLINTQLNLPLQFGIDSFDFEAGYTINFPSALDNESDLPTTGFFNLSVAYMIGL